MDGRERRPSRYATPYQEQADGRSNSEQQSMGHPTQSRYSQGVQSPTGTDASRLSISRPFGTAYGSYDYPPHTYATPQVQSASAMQGVEMQYQPYVHDTSRHSQIHHSPHQQHFSPYGQGSMLPSMQQQSVYDTLPFQQRQSAAIEALASHFSMPQYMQHGDSSSVGTASTHYMTSQADQTIYTSLPMTRSQLQPAFASHADDYTMLEPSGGHAPQESEDDEAAQAAAAAQVTQDAQEALESGRLQYERTLRGSFDAIIAGRVTEAKDKLLAASRWLLSSTTPLGLQLDDESQYQTRLAIWRELNHCWEALGLKQKDITEQAIQTKHAPTDMLTRDTIIDLVNELVSMCDQVEGFGLVDYEMGIWEEQIVAIFIACLDLLEHGRQPRTRGNT